MDKKIFLTLLLPLSVYAENLQELINLTKENKMVQASKIRVDSANYEYESIKDSYMPSVTLNGKTHYTSYESVGLAQSGNTLSATLKYTIYDGGKKEHLYNAYESNINSAQNIQHSLENSVALQVTNYYYTYLSLLSKNEAKTKEILQLKSDLDRLNKFFDVGTATNDEVQKIVSRVESANVDLSEIELNLQTILHQLEYIVGKSPNIENGSLVEEYLPKVSNQRADIKALENSMQTALANAKAQKSADYPTIYIDNTFSKYNLNYDDAKYNGYDDDYTQNTISLNLSWSLFDFGSRNEAYIASYKKYLALKSEYEYEKNRASVDLKLALRAYEIAKQKILSAKAGLNAANTTYEAIKAKYENGLVDNVSYLEALSEKYSSISVLKSAMYDLEIKKANIIYHSGKNIEEFVK